MIIVDVIVVTVVELVVIDRLLSGGFVVIFGSSVVKGIFGCNVVVNVTAVSLVEAVVLKFSDSSLKIIEFSVRKNRPHKFSKSVSQYEFYLSLF